MSSTNSHALRYRADIDGLRAVAVLAVLFFHVGLGFPGGFVGVDVFFVISGFLITGLILKDLERGHFHIVEFWERRVRRILPALAVVVLSTLVAGWFLFFPPDFQELGQSAVAQTLLLSNVYFWRESGYFAQAAEVKPLLHTWSLAVEEQFYLLFPLLLLAVKRFSRFRLTTTILLLGAASFALSVFCSYRYPSVNFYLLPTRAWELLVGAYLAALPAREKAAGWVRESLSWVGLSGILVAVFGYGAETRFPGASALLPCIGAGLLIWANSPTLTAPGRLLAARPVVFVGLISYSLYLWHWPLLVFAKYYSTLGPLTVGSRALLLLASLVLAVLSWRFVETPFRKRVIFEGRVPIFTFAGVTAGILVGAGLAIHLMKGAPARIPEEAVRYAEGRSDRAFLDEVGLAEAKRGEFGELGRGDKAAPIDLLVWGDSHAMAAMPALDTLCKELRIRGVAATHSSTAPLVGFESKGKYSLKAECIPFNNAVVDFIRKEKVRDALLVAVWGAYVVNDDPAELRRGLVDTIAALKSAGTRVWIMKSVPGHRWNVPIALASTAFHGGSVDALGLPVAAHRDAHRIQDQLFAGLDGDGVTVLDPTSLFVSANGLCRVAEGGKALYCDEQHLTVAGAMILRPLFAAIFAGATKGATQPGVEGVGQ